MTEAEFLRLPHDPGWKYEYAGGAAHITPRHVVVPMRADVTRRAVDAGDLQIRPVVTGDAPGLVRAFFEGFRDTVEYCDWTDAKIRRSGEDAIQTFFGGRRGAFHPSSCLAVSPAQPHVVAGAALIVQKPDGPFLDMLFVLPRRHRRGLATALVGAAMNALHDMGEAHLGSAHDLANQPSRAWHERFGFGSSPTTFWPASTRRPPGMSCGDGRRSAACPTRRGRRSGRRPNTGSASPSLWKTPPSIAAQQPEGECNRRRHEDQHGEPDRPVPGERNQKINVRRRQALREPGPEFQPQIVRQVPDGEGKEEQPQPLPRRPARPPAAPISSKIVAASRVNSVRSTPCRPISAKIAADVKGSPRAAQICR